MPDPVLGIVEVEHDPLRHLGEAVAEQLDHRRHHALERDWSGQVLEPAHGRLRAQVSRALGQPTDRHLEHRVDAQRVAVVGVGVAGCDQERAEADHLGEPVLDPIRRPRVLEAACQAFGDPEATLDLGQHQHPAIRAQPPGVEGDLHRLAGDG